MKVASILFKQHDFILGHNDDRLDFSEAQLVLGFGSSALVSQQSHFDAIKSKFPNAQIALCSSAGEIFGISVLDDTISLVAIAFSSTMIQTVAVDIDQFSSSYEAGVSLITSLPAEQLKMVFVLSDGGKVNGSELVKGMNTGKNDGVLITGGLAGDGTSFEKTFVGLNQLPESGKIVAIGLYGAQLEVSHGSIGGWESFGMERTVTRSKDNVLYEIDHKNALDFYKNYLGKYAEELPSSALLFPLSIKFQTEKEPIVRTILSIDEKNQSMTFAGDIPELSKVRFMKANFDRLIDAANDAALDCLAMSNTKAKLAILISCVGRKIILSNRIDEEIEAVADVFGDTTLLTGFYSYGEISPLQPMSNCELHNQTMTITCINELE